MWGLFVLKRFYRCCRREVDFEIGSWIMVADSMSCIDWFGFLEKGMMKN